MKRFLVIAAAFVAFSGIAHADGDPAKGAVVFKKCAICHTADKGGPNRIGPNLNGVIGRDKVDGYAYSDAAKAWHDAGNKWDEAKLTKWLADPKAFIPGTKMTFVGLSDPGDIADVIAYIKSK